MNEIFNKLSEDLPAEGIQKTKGSQTKKGYDTSGYGYQYCVDMFNDVCGEKWGFDWHIIETIKGNYKTGTPYFDVIIEISIWVNDKENKRSCVGDHTAITFGNALKGAITNGFKKTASFWGVGAKAYRGSLDEDNAPLPDSHENIQDKKSQKQKGNFKKVMEILNGNPITLEQIESIKKGLSERSWTEKEQIEIYDKINELELKLNPFDDSVLPGTKTDAPAIKGGVDDIV